ncbi:hypothetical protein GPDM_07155 [Planococcus donghaensis MPA1U2]|uniref:Uncharacterized protein n=1 Tax=Planococcus donghaensis MPA1U2 TaxID=933115 RepID=E7RG33_9BACL|nr:hypothetical protein [Planococcus donghaensis]EGA90040.1 hypothetical protein GPDM_07155 [Planococcus donghaensis MPA1U2]
MWALITGSFMFVMAVLFSLGKASSKREEATHSHREELLARGKNHESELTTTVKPNTESSEQQQSHKGNNARQPSEQV